MRIWQGICLSAVVLVAFATLCHAQSITPEDEYKKLIKVDQDIQPLGANPFGEQISLYDGTLSFKQTDVSLSGNGPTITLTRSLTAANALPYSLNANRPLGDWELEIPRIETTVGGPTISPTWQVPAANPLARCTSFGPPPVEKATQTGAAPWDPSEYWYGYHLIVPGTGSQELLNRDTLHNPLTPTQGGKTFPIITKQNWMIHCGVTADDGGEGFVALAPDGTEYTFTHLMYRPAPNITKDLHQVGSAVAATGLQPQFAPFSILDRRDALMLVTQVKDRFGNTLSYGYDSLGRLNRISASDGRSLTLQYVSSTSPLISAASVSSASAGTRTWNYSYDTTTNPYLPTLTGVTLPDGSAWSFQLNAFQTSPVEASNSNCYAGIVGAATGSPAVGKIIHPSGLVGTFTTRPAMHGRSYVRKHCFGGEGGVADEIYTSIPNVSYQQSIASKVFSGAGIPTETWTYSYSPSNQSWTTDACASAGTCPSTVYMDVVDPEGRDVRSTFSNRFDATEGLLLRTDYFTNSNASPILRSEVNAYADPVGGPWPVAYGIDPQDRDNRVQTEEVSPLQQRTINQDGDTYTWAAEAFDAYAQPTDVKRYSSITGQTTGIEETTTYLNDTNLWVLGLPLQVTNNTTGEVESTNTYTPSNDTLLTRARFGQTLMHYTFNSTGQLASFTDGNSHTTTLGSYKRGIPQAIGYPDNTSETLAVDDFGQISAITDQAGHATSYSYDPVGRITGISYPTGDEVAWLPTTFAYSFVTGAERGVAANHWRRTTTTGNAKAVTYFDAMLRPVLSDNDIGSTVAASTLSTYDSKGQKLFSAYPNAAALAFAQTPTVAGSKSIYDALGRVTQVQQDSELGTLTNSTAYLSGARQQVTDPKGNVTTTSYQVFDQPSYDAVIKVQAPAGITQAISRDLYGNPLSITQSGLYGTESKSVNKTLIYDSYHRLCRTTEPESGSEIMGYDSANNLVWSVAGATLGNDGSCHPELAQSTGVTTRTYDAMNRVLTIQPPSGTQATAYTYDALGNVATTVSGIAIQGFSHNFRGMLTNEALWIPSVNSSWSLTYNHDAYGSVSAIHYPDGETVSYAPDAQGRPTKAGSYANGVSYFPNGQVSQFIYGNGAAYVTEQNTRQLLSSFSYGKDGTPQLSEDLAYDKNGNITAVTDLAGGPRTKAFGYDALNRLTSAQSGGLAINETYAYDPLNNLRSRWVGGQTLTYTYDASNKLASINNGASTISSYVYDNRGNVINNNGVNLTFDQKNQLTQIQGLDSYAYDASGRRVMKTLNSTAAPVYYLYSQAGQLMYQADVASLKSTNFIYLGRQLVARNVSAASTLTTPAISGTGNYTVSWNSTNGATSYTLQEQVNGGAWATIQSSSATSKAISGKANGSYGYKVQACNASSCGPWSNVAITTVVFPPPTPASITIPATSSGSVAVSWAASSTATSYTLQRANYGITGWSTAYTGSATSYTAHETVSGAWIYQVQACNAGGCSAFRVSSSGVTVTLPPASAPALTVPATSYTGGYTVSWSALTGATSYTLQEQINGGSWTTIQATSATNKALSGKGSGTYGYRVQGCNVSGCGPSSTKTITVTRIPAVPASISAPTSEPYPAGSWTVSWAAVGGATSYTLQRTNTATSAVVAVYSGSADSTIDGHSLLLIPDPYVYAVKACNVAGCSGWRNSAALVMFCPRSPGVAKPGSVQPDQISCGGTP